MTFEPEFHDYRPSKSEMPVPLSALAEACRRVLLGAFLAPSFVVLLSSLAVAAPTSAELDTARKLFAEAEKDQDAGRWDFALRKLLGVASIKETPGVRFHIGNCQENLGRLLEALDSFQRAQSLAEDQRTKDVIALVGPRIEHLRKRIPTLTVRVTGVQGEVSVQVDDKPIDSTLLGTPIGFDPGEHVVLVQFPGEAPLRRSVALADFRGETIEFSRPGPSPIASNRPVSPVAESRDTASGPSIPTAAWLSFGGAVALGVGGWLSYRKAGQIADDSLDACARALACDPERADTVRRYDALALGLWSAGAVAVGTGVVLTLVSSRSASAPKVSVHPSGVTVHGAF